MSIYKAAIDRIESSKMSGVGTANILQMMLQQIVATGASSVEFTLGFVEEGDIVPEGVLLPEIVLRLKPNHRLAGDNDGVGG